MVGRLHVADDYDAPIVTAFYPLSSVQGRRRSYKVNWPDLRMLFHAETGGEKSDPFHDLSNMSSSSRERRETLISHLISDVHWAFLLQHRTFLYTLYFNGDYLRILRWSRAGIMVTKPVFYLDDPSVLPRLICRLTHLTDEQQGLDTSVTRVQVGSVEYKFMHELGHSNYDLDIPYKEGTELRPVTPSSSAPASPSSAAPDASQSPEPSDDERVFRYVREGYAKTLEDVWPRYCIKVGEEGREFLVAKPVSSAEELFGRGCNCYIAVDCTTGKLVWLKDSWRPVGERSTPEGEVLKAFADDPKMSVPTLICHGYVKQSGATFHGPTSSELDAAAAPLPATQEKTTLLNAGEKGTAADDGRVIGVKRAREEDSQPQPEAKKRTRQATPRLPEYAQYRLVVKEVALDLERFTSAWQLVRLIFECIKTHSRAWKEYGILHGDISEGNILICPTISKKKDGKEVVVWHGMLIDWELARFVDKDGNPIRPRTQNTPLLSWQFASLGTVRNPDKVLRVEDELEAFFNVLLLYAVRFLRSTLPQRSVAPFVEEFWDTFKMHPNGSLECSDLKQKALKKGQLEGVGVGDIMFCDDGGAPVHPLNGLLRELLQRFQARYAHLQWEADMGMDNPLRPTLGLPGTRAVLGEASRNVAANPQAPVTVRPVRPPLSPKTIELAHSLQTHTAVIKLFSKWMIDQGWPLHDKVGDRLPDDYVSTRRIVPVRPPVNVHMKMDAGRKRQKLEDKSVGGAPRRQSS
ncbi:hypothetical protein C8Q70DRAFT_923816 [Cubamyces menziesii]|nr:hypothetical protein C8Q70DRAFT_923816 [Cubamyces menziesii]